MRLISGRVILAAARLALFYTAVVILEIGILQFALLSGFPTLRSIGRMALALSIPFIAAFVLLGLARRWGFVALWLILAGFWIYLSRHFGGIWPLDPTLFLSWSIFALPLWIIGQAGIPSRSLTILRVGAIRFSTSTALLVCWAALLVVPFFPAVIDVLYGWRIAHLSKRVWQAAPFVLSAYALWHVWRGTATMRSAADLRVTDHPSYVSRRDVPLASGL